ncbi:MAG: HAD family hydrolase [Candidatus Bathyarchaeia archaeon]
MGVKAISFDLDGTLVDYTFIDSIWFDEIPKLYSAKHHVSFEEAKKTVIDEYDKVGEDNLEWYDLKYWLRRFNLDYDPGRLLTENMNKVRVYRDAKEALTRFYGNYILAINSNSPIEFIEVELKQAGLNGFFQHVFSSTSHFHQVKKTPECYVKVCNAMGVSPNELMHVGDNRRFDYEVPSSIGVKAIYLDRKRRCRGDTVVHNLKQLVEVLRRIDC